MKYGFWTLVLLLSAIFLPGCKSLNPSVMLRTPKDYKFSSFPPTQVREYKIAPNDQIGFNIYSNDGFKLIDVTAINSSGSGQGNYYNMVRSPLSFKVEYDGMVKLPLLGRISVQGLTIKEAEHMLEEKYSSFYNKPFVLLEVTNKKVIIFPGAQGAARVLEITRENTTLLEALAQAGGISQNGKAYNIKLIRGNLKDPEIFLIDLSTIEGMKQADLVLQANDIIYVTPQLRMDTTIMAQILPYLSFISTMLIFYTLVSRKTI